MSHPEYVHVDDDEDDDVIIMSPEPESESSSVREIPLKIRCRTEIHKIPVLSVRKVTAAQVNKRPLCRVSAGVLSSASTAVRVTLIEKY